MSPGSERLLSTSDATTWSSPSDGSTCAGDLGLLSPVRPPQRTAPADGVESSSIVEQLQPIPVPDEQPTDRLWGDDPPS